MYGIVYQIGLYLSADTTNNFKTRLDKYWHNQDIIYDFTAPGAAEGSKN